MIAGIVSCQFISNVPTAILLTGTVSIFADGKRIYTSPMMGKTSSPIKIDIDIKGCNVLKIEYSNDAPWWLGFAEAGLYQ